MAGPQPVRIALLALPVVFAVGFGVTSLMKLKRAEQQADTEESRRPRSMAVDPARPAWFRNLDRDNDGRVTRTEFVGTEEVFGAIDANLDGVITPPEAHAADEWFRRQVAGEPASP